MRARLSADRGASSSLRPRPDMAVGDGPEPETQGVGEVLGGTGEIKVVNGPRLLSLLPTGSPVRYGMIA